VSELFIVRQKLDRVLSTHSKAISMTFSRIQQKLMWCIQINYSAHTCDSFLVVLFNF